jgi:pimeloyl-ACP methyl ester carboxylesterase
MHGENQLGEKEHGIEAGSVDRHTSLRNCAFAIMNKQIDTTAPMPNWAAEALAMPCRSGFLDVHGCAIHYLAWGDTTMPPLMLIHGNAASAEWWRFVAPLLASEYHVIAPDLGGMGDSAHCGRYERERYAEQVMAVADTLAPGLPPFMLGHSLGGYVAIMAGCAHSERMAGLVILDSPAREPAGTTFAPKVNSSPVPKIYKDRATALQRFKLLPEQPVNCGFYLDHIAQTSIKEEAGGWRWKFDPAATSHQRRLEFVQDLLDMHCPVSLMWGGLSERFDDFARGITRAAFGCIYPLVEIPNARHHVMLDEPLALVTALRTQLAVWRIGSSSRKWKPQP